MCPQVGENCVKDTKEEDPLGGAPSLLFTKYVGSRIVFMVLELFTILLLATFARMKMHNLL